MRGWTSHSHLHQLCCVVGILRVRERRVSLRLPASVPSCVRLSGGNAAREGHDMRAIDCSCGEHLEGASDEELMPMVQEHMEQVHPDMQMSDEEKQALFTQMVHDV